MSPFVIFVIVLTVAYIIYFGVTITNDLYGKKNQVKTNEDFFDVSSMNEPNQAIEVNEAEGGFQIGNEEKVNNKEASASISSTPMEESLNPILAEKKICEMVEKMEDIDEESSSAMDQMELEEALRHINKGNSNLFATTTRDKF